MKKSLFILGQLTDEDVDWLIEHGTKTPMGKGEILIIQGEPIEELYITLKGKFEVVNERSGVQLALIGSGEILGEMSYIDERPPSATVKVLDDSLVYVLKRKEITEKLQEDSKFASRFYKALAIMLSDRLRHVQGPIDNEDIDELDMSVIDKLHLAGSRFDRIMKKFDTN